MGSDRWPPASGTAARRLGESTRALRLPPPVPSQHPLGTPVYRTAAFAFDSPAQYAAVLAGTAPGCTYSQIDNPTVDAFGAAVAGLDTPHGGREAGMAFA